METTSSSNLVLGAGIAGIAAAWRLRQKGQQCIILEKDDDWGGLCGHFVIDGFRFDRFVHFSFAPDAQMAQLFESSSPMYSHVPVCYNYYHGCWLRHPAQNNLAPLPAEGKVRIIEDFVNRPHKDSSEISRYDEWLRVQYGNYFAEHFPFAYTRKYWGHEAGELETRWVGERMRISPLTEVLRGAFNEQDENYYYTAHMNYPKKGGYRSILNSCREGLDIRFRKKVVAIDPRAQTVSLDDGTCFPYERLYSSLPLPEMVRLIPDCPKEVQEAAAQLSWTCGYQVSLGFNRPDVAKYLWFYIYDEDVPPARVYSPNLKSPDNVPAECSALQAEVFYANDAVIPPPEEVWETTVNQLKTTCRFSEEDIIVRDIRFEPYANVAFTPPIYSARECIHAWLRSHNIAPIGRFGLWDYLWSHQTFAQSINLT